MSPFSTRGVSLAALTLTLATGSAWAAAVEDRETRTVPLPPGGVVEIHSSDGDVALHGIEGTEVRVLVHRQARSSSRDRALEMLRSSTLQTERTSDGLRIAVSTPESGGWLGWWGRDESARADLRVGVPAVARVRVYVRNGDVLVESSGHSAVVKSTNGDITILGMEGEHLEASTVNGDVAIRLISLPSGSRLDASSVNGDLKVVVPDHLRAAIDARTTNGCVASSVALTESRKSRSQVVGLVNGGGGQIRLRTTNGQIRVQGE